MISHRRLPTTQHTPRMRVQVALADALPPRVVAPDECSFPAADPPAARGSGSVRRPGVSPDTWGSSTGVGFYSAWGTSEQTGG